MAKTKKKAEKKNQYHITLKTMLYDAFFLVVAGAEAQQMPKSVVMQVFLDVCDDYPLPCDYRRD